METLQEVRLMLEGGHLHGAANRIYYACFYAATALLLTRGLSSPRHSGIMALFNRHFVKEGIMSIDMGKFYSRVFDSRLESDYGDVVELSEEDVRADFDEGPGVHHASQVSVAVGLTFHTGVGNPFVPSLNRLTSPAITVLDGQPKDGLFLYGSGRLWCITWEKRALMGRPGCWKNGT